jgi:hypothetical protein
VGEAGEGEGVGDGMSDDIQDVALKVHRHLREAENAWLTKIFKAFLPDEIFRKAYGTEQDKMEVAAYLEREGYFMNELPNGVKQVKKGKEVLAQAAFETQYLS